MGMRFQKRLDEMIKLLESVHCPSSVRGSNCKKAQRLTKGLDLAGSEKHTSSKERNAEGKHINQS